MDLELTGEVWEWRGPAPYHFVSVPQEACEEIAAVAAALTYGWGMIPVEVTIGATSWATSLWAKDGGYVVPLKTWVREAESVAVGDVVRILLRVDG